MNLPFFEFKKKNYEFIYELCDGDINKFVLLLRKGIYPYEFMDSWKRFDETLLPDIEGFYSSLNMEGIIDIDHRHAKRVWKYFKIKNVGEYHNFYVQSDTLLLVDVFENFKNKYIEIYELDPSHFLSAPGLEKGIRGGICHAIHRYAKANHKYMKDYDKNNESSCLMYLDAKNLYGWAISQKLPEDGFNLEKNISKFNEEFIKNYYEKSDKGYILEVDVKYPKKLHNLHNDLAFLPERMKIKKCNKLVSNLYDKNHLLHT